MIDARELRIGNIVYFNNYEQLDINQIKTLTFIDFEQICYDKHANRFSPIQLTQEILEKWCGFNDGEIRISDNTYLILDEDEGYNVFIKQFNAIGSTPDIETVLMPKCIKYLHHLQNLYFALTGEELKVNL